MTLNMSRLYPCLSLRIGILRVYNSLATLKEKELEKIESDSKLYDELTKRHLRMMENVDVQLDAMSRFEKDESQLYFKRKELMDRKQVLQLIRYYRDSHAKESHVKVKVCNNKYIMQADKALKKLT